MRFLFDQNISHRILAMLPEQFSDSSSIKKEGLINSTDREIWEFAKRNNFIIVTQDSDFNDLNLLLGFPPKIIWIRTGNLRIKAIMDILITYKLDIEKFISDAEHGCFEIIKFKY
jgi:predicted nuclease of predicted toxin-antitoxin system